jgi:hypothetical protein
MFFNPKGKNMGKVKAWAMQLEEDFWYLANSKIGNCEFFGEFMQEMEQHRDFLGLRDDREYADMLREAWDNYWSKYI